ncbi:MAG: hypothetical protein QW728_05070, partial [Thermoplasmata archaeon]
LELPEGLSAATLMKKVKEVWERNQFVLLKEQVTEGKEFLAQAYFHSTTLSGSDVVFVVCVDEGKRLIEFIVLSQEAAAVRSLLTDMTIKLKKQLKADQLVKVATVRVVNVEITDSIIIRSDVLGLGLTDAAADRNDVNIGIESSIVQKTTVK